MVCAVTERCLHYSLRQGSVIYQLRPKLIRKEDIKRVVVNADVRHDG